MQLAGRLMSFAASGALVVAQLAPLPVLAPVGTALGVAPAAAQTQRTEIQCYAAQGQQNSCALPPGTRSVTYLGPDRSGICREGQTWRKRGNSLWVANGCGGMFEVTYAGGGSGGSGGNWGGSGGNWGGSGGSGGFVGEITCRSRNYEAETCNVPTGGRVEVVQQISREPCIQGQTFRFDSRSITVRNGCQARFGYGYGNSGGGWGGSGGGWGNDGFQAELRCSSNGNRYQRCPADTQGRVILVRQVSQSACTQGSSWGFDNGGIWVNRGCQGYFAYGYGNYRPNSSGETYPGNQGNQGGGGGSGVAAGLLGAGLAAGLIALINSKGSKADASNPNARISANYGLFPGGAQAEAKACMEEASRQLGHSGASAVTLNSVASAQPSGGGWRLVSDVTGTWPKETSRLEVDCVASGTKVTAFDVKAR